MLQSHAMSMDTSQKTESIDQLVASVDAGDVVLPEFQRDFVWEEYKTHELFDSLIRDIFIGSLIFGVPSFELTVRELDSRPRKGPGSRAKLNLISFTKAEINKRVKSGQFRLLLDGQQRATSLFRALKGIDQVWVVIKREDELSDEVRSAATSSRTLEDVLYEVASKQSPDRLSINISDCFKMLRGEIDREREKAAIFGASEFGRQLPGEIADTPEFGAYLHYTGRLQNLFRAEKLLAYYLLDTDEEKFSLFFERSNSRGIQLNFIDILAAKLYAGFNLRTAADKFKDQHPGYALRQNELVRTVAFVVSGGRDIGRQYILSKLNHVHFTDHWDNLCTLYQKSLDFLFDNHLLIAQSWLPYDSLLIPLMAFLREVPGNDFSQISDLQSRFLRYWYWSSTFSQRYSSASQELIILDANVLMSIARGENDFDRKYLRKFHYEVAEASDLMTISKKYNAIYRGVINLVHWNASGVMDWSNNDRITFKAKNLDDHHVFPRKYLRNTSPDMPTKHIDSVLNRALIPKITNIKIGAKRPGQYLGELKKANPRLESALEQHLIPAQVADGSYDELFEIFLEDRAKRILEVLDSKVRAEATLLEQELFGPDE